MEPQTPAATPYPLQLAVDYPDRDLNRGSTAFRIFAAIPIMIVAGLVTTGGWHWTLAIGGGGILFLPTLLMVVVR